MLSGLLPAQANAALAAYRAHGLVLMQRISLDGWATPVSYTHLDVYKRQAISDAALSFKGQPMYVLWITK